MQCTIGNSDETQRRRNYTTAEAIETFVMEVFFETGLDMYVSVGFSKLEA